MRPILIHGIAFTSVACAGCGILVEIPPELQGGEQDEPYYCDSCEKKDTSGQEYRERMYSSDDELEIDDWWTFDQEVE